MLVSDATPAGAARLETLLDPQEWAAQRARPRYQPGYTLAALEGDRVIGTAFLAHERRRIGAGVLNIAAVTLPAAADQRLFEPVLVAAATAGLAWLEVRAAFGAALLGMAACRLQSRLVLPDLPLQGISVRRAHPDDTADLTALGAGLAAQAPFSSERTPADWRWLIVQPWVEVLMVEDERGRTAGYALHEPGFGIGEAYAADAGIGRAFLAELKARGIVTLPLGPAHPLAHTALVHGGRLELMAPTGHAPRWGVIDLAAALREVAPELGARLRRSAYAGWAGSVHLETGGTSVAIDIRNDRVEVQSPPMRAPDLAVRRIALEALPQLLLGYRALADLKASGALQCAESDLGLLDVLFPQLPLI